MALTRLGQSRITALSQTGLAPELCKLYYEPTRNELLSEQEWSFATKRANISLSGDENLSSFTYMYNLPTDLLRVVTLISSEDYSDIADAWELEGIYLLTGINPGYIKYIKQVTNPTQLPQLFVEAFYLRLATKMCIKLTQDQSLLGVIWQEYMAAMQTAMGICGANKKQKQTTTPLWSE